jgi:hypothetical protein
MGRMPTLPLPASGALADQGATVTAGDFAPESHEAEAEAIVRAGRLRRFSAALAVARTGRPELSAPTPHGLMGKARSIV